jgi:hypothetical protein
MTVADELLVMERKFWTEGATFFRDHADAACLVAFTSMTAVMDRDALAATVKNAPRWRAIEMDMKGFVSPQPELAILSYRASAERADGKRYTALVSSAYAKRAEGWKLAFHQQTPLAGD